MCCNGRPVCQYRDWNRQEKPTFEEFAGTREPGIVVCIASSDVTDTKRAQTGSTVQQRTPSYMALPCTTPRACAARFDRGVIWVQSVIDTLRCAGLLKPHHVSMRLKQCGLSAGSRGTERHNEKPERDQCRERVSTLPPKSRRFAGQISMYLFTEYWPVAT